MSRAYILLPLIALLELYYCAWSHAAATTNSACIIRIATGRIRGNCSHPNYAAYTRIPYARPPIGALRLEAPQPAVKWRGVLAANAPVATCVQFTQLLPQQEGSEDCLYINVYVPKRVQKQRQALMVIMWIYPGAFQFGNPTNSAELVMSLGEAIVVTFAYRVGPTGFLSTSDYRIPGNFGLKDQRLAIRWVQQNIAAFGGDAKQLVLLGDSAGGASVHYHMITASGRNVRAFVSMSGSILNPWAFTQRSDINARQLGKELNCSFDAPGRVFKDCLKSKRIEDIWQANKDMHRFYAFHDALFRPTVEPKWARDAFLTSDPMELIRAGNYRDKPYLVGTVEGEGAYLAASFLQFNTNNIEAIEELNTRWLEVCPIIFYYDEKQTANQQWRTCDKLQSRYMCGKQFNIDSYRLLERMFGDEYFYNGIDETVKLHRAAGQKVYRYIANLPTRKNMGNFLAKARTDLCFGSVHTADAFGILPLAAPATQTPVERNTLLNLIKLIQSMVKQDSPPLFNGVPLPANTNNTLPDQCLYFSYGSQHIAKCELQSVDCEAPIPSVKCTN